MDEEITKIRSDRTGPSSESELRTVDFDAK
jgi:hypothetical protein